MSSSLYDVFSIILLFALFGFVHSLLAANKVKRLFIHRLRDLIAFYRLFYVLSSLALLYLILRISPHPEMTIYKLDPPFDVVILILQLLSFAGLIWSLKYFSIKEFLGFSQILRWKRKIYDLSEMDEKLTLIIGGPYKFSRHPLYLFFILVLALKSEMDLYYLTCLICIIAYTYVGSIFEEKKLEIQFGEKYTNYKNSVPRIIPYKANLFRRPDIISK
jgi:protein-S-isoprenylcysteine O-methyltransferase Ste14